jgi:hypothetical protein
MQEFASDQYHLGRKLAASKTAKLPTGQTSCIPNRKSGSAQIAYSIESNFTLLSTFAR